MPESRLMTQISVDSDFPGRAKLSHWKLWEAHIPHPHSARHQPAGGHRAPRRRLVFDPLVWPQGLEGLLCCHACRHHIGMDMVEASDIRSTKEFQHQGGVKSCCVCGCSVRRPPRETEGTLPPLNQMFFHRCGTFFTSHGIMMTRNPSPAEPGTSGNMGGALDTLPPTDPPTDPLVGTPHQGTQNSLTGFCDSSETSRIV